MRNTLAAIRAGDLCGAPIALLPVTGAAVSTLSGPINHDTVCASDKVAFRLAELQFDLGEGPCWEAFVTRRPILIADVSVAPDAAWPVFGAAIADTGAAAVFAFPLYVGMIGVGALELYRDVPGPLTDDEVRDAETIADAVAVELLRRVLDPTGAGQDGDAEAAPGLSRDRRQVHQATGMIMETFDISVGAAFARLRASAFANDSTVAAVAARLVSEEIRVRDVIDE